MIRVLTGFSSGCTALALFASLVVGPLGCGGGSDAEDLEADGGPAGMVDGGDPGDDPGDPDVDPQALDPAACAAFASSMADAAGSCGAALPAGAQQAVQGWCEDGIDLAQMCGGDPEAGFDCFAASDADDWICSLGEPYPSCGGDTAAALGMYCVMALGNPACASGIRCEYDVDCGAAGSCNSVTGQCFSDDAYCVGLPCAYDVDCPSGETCNGAEGACVGA